MNKPNDIIPLSKLNLSHWQQIKSSSGYKEYIPKLIDINPDQDKQYNHKWRSVYFCFSLVFLQDVFKLIVERNVYYYYQVFY